MAVKKSTTGDISFRSASVAGNGGPHGGPYRYYRIVATSATASTAFEAGYANETDLRTFTLTEDAQGISDIKITEVVDAGGYPTTNINDTDLDDPPEFGTATIGPYTQGGISVTAGYSIGESFTPDQAFDNNGTQFWWTKLNGDANINWLQIDMLQPRNISKFTFRFRGNDSSGAYHEAQYTRILASNDPTFATYTIFGIFNFGSRYFLLCRISLGGKDFVKRY